MKTRNILISLLSIACLVGCSRNGPKSESSKSEAPSSQSSSQQASSSSEAPASSDISSEVPVQSSEQPVQSSEEPVQSSEAPVETSSEAPVETTSEQPAESSETSVESSEQSQSSQQDVDLSKLVIEEFGTARLEAENFDTGGWASDDIYDGEYIIEDDKASGGAYLGAAAPGSGSQALFSFELKAFSRVTFYAAYAQIEGQTNRAIDMTNVYSYTVESVSSFETISGKNTLAARNSASKWDVMQYTTQDLYPGVYNVSLDLLDDAEYCPSIDYVEFKTTDATVTPVDPSSITEADIPDNDMRNLQQYKFLHEEDLTKYKTYATGADLSAPRGMKLRFEEVETASKYYVQIAESEEGLAEAPVRETTENKVYTFHNAKLATKYYYRAATSEEGLAQADVLNITSTDVAPRVVYVPDVLNFRDIGGWESSLVPGAKINQGLYYRCAQLDAASGSTKSCLDSAGKGLAALKELGIKCDIDMRDSYNQPNRGSGPSKANTTEWPITFVSAAVASGTENVRWEGGSSSDRSIAQQYVKIFNAIANCDNEPCMLHCTYGADRTGIVTFFLESLLGMSEEDMTRDYVWTQFTQGRNIKLTESDAEFPKWISKTKDCEGDTFADKMENHLISFGIEKSTLEHIREIFVPGYAAQA